MSEGLISQKEQQRFLDLVQRLAELNSDELLFLNPVADLKDKELQIFLSPLLKKALALFFHYFDCKFFLNCSLFSAGFFFGNNTIKK